VAYFKALSWTGFGSVAALGARLCLCGTVRSRTAERACNNSKMEKGECSRDRTVLACDGIASERDLEVVADITEEHIARGMKTSSVRGAMGPYSGAPKTTMTRRA